MNLNLNLGSLFDGSGGFPLAAIKVGIKPIWASEIEPFCIRVTQKNLPQVKHLGDIENIDGGEIEPVDIISFGSPCFPKGTLVLTDKGHIPIEHIKIGMKVLTHKGRWKKVIDFGYKRADTIKLKGNHYGLECTKNHPIYTKKDNSFYWNPASNMLNKKWAVPNDFERLKIPIPIRTSLREKEMPSINEDLMYFVGRWIGDGWVRDAQRNNRPKGQRLSTIFLCDSFDKENELIACFEKISKRYSIEYGNTALKIKTNGRLLCDWLTDNFGRYAHGKKIAPWAFSMSKNMRISLLQGILDSDGYEYKKNHFKVSTVSKKLAMDIRLLAETLGYSTTIYYFKTKDTTTIQGRKVNQMDVYEVALIKPDKRHKDKDDLHSWYKVRNISEGRKNQQVYNLTVEEDNSYLADGIVVHNCQNLSIAGKREGLEGSKSSLFYEAIRVIKEMRCQTGGKYPRYIIWENVPGAFSSNKGEDFRAVLNEISNIKDEDISIPKPKKWCKSGEIVGRDFSLAWRILDAKYFGVPQRRRRIFLVADFNGRRAREILFDQESLSWDLKKSQEERKRNPQATKGCPNQTICLNDQGGERMDFHDEVSGTLRAKAGNPPFVFENHGQDSRFKGPLEESPTLSSSLGTGGNNQPFIVYDIRQTSENTKNERHNIYACDVSRTIDTSGNTPTRNQGGVAIVEDIYSMSKNSHFTRADKNISSPLVATDYKDPPLVSHRLVRRLTPKECGRLQGFPDDWCEDLAIENPTEDDLKFWRAVFAKDSEVRNLKKKKTDSQIIKWLNNPHTDSAEYKMWGNGIALPCAVYIFKKMVGNSSFT